MPFQEILDHFDKEAHTRDTHDPLRHFRDRFYHTPGRIYLDGNSLGLLSRDAEACVLRVLSEWRDHGVEGWTNADNPWFTLAERLGAQTAPLIGAEPNAVIATGSTTVNLHQLLATLFAPTEARNKIVCDALNFPSDIFAIESHLHLRGLEPTQHLVKIPSRDNRTLHEADILAALARGDVQMAILPSVIYTSGQLLPLRRITQAARENRVCIGWDLSHSIGAVPHDLDAWNADFAFWCFYKYLNAGPGSVGGLYLNRRHFGRAPGLAGWFGSHKETQFAMTHEFSPAQTAGALQIGTTHVLSLAPLEGTLQIHREAGMENLREKSLALTDFLRTMVEEILTPHGVSVCTPRPDDERGGHLALIHPHAAAVSRALRAANVVPDFRPPDIVRLAPVPLYTGFGDCVEAVRRLHHILTSESLVNRSAELVP